MQNYTPLFYDKLNGNNQYSNSKTRHIDIPYINKMQFKELTGNDAKILFKSLNDIEYPDFDEKFVRLKIYQHDKESYTVIYINNELLEEYVEKKKIPNEQFLARTCYFHIMYLFKEHAITTDYSSLINTNLQNAISSIMKNTSYDDFDEIEQPKQIIEKLFSYQKRSIKWMIDKEKNIKQISYNENSKEVIIGNTYYDSREKLFRNIKDRDVLTFYGGGIIDEVGLGKTVQITALTLLNTPISVNYYSNDKFLHSKATLVICPNHLCKQWERELKKMIKPEYKCKVELLLTKTHFDDLTYEKILIADYVIVSYQFLGNKVYSAEWLKQISNRINYLSNTHVDHNKLNTIFTKIRNKIYEDPLNAIYNKRPNLSAIYWYRVVVDEFHETTTNAKYKHVQHLLRYIQGNYKWCVTGTPFSKNENLIDMINFITNYKFEKELLHETNSKIFICNDIIEYVSHQCFRRNTKRDVENEFKPPPIKEKIFLLTFTMIERMIYKAYQLNEANNEDSVFLRQLCCHPNIAEETKDSLGECKTLEDMKRSMVDHYLAKVNTAQRDINNNELKILRTKKRIRIKEVKIIAMKEEDEYYEDDELDLDKFTDPYLDKVCLTLNHSKNEYITADKKIIKIRKYLLDMHELLNTYIYNRINLQKKFDGANSSYQFFNNVINKIKKIITFDENGELIAKDKNDIIDSDSDSEDNDEKCGICLGSIVELNIGVTKCGHLFCFNCIKEYTLKVSKCPACLVHINNNEVYQLSFTLPKKNEPATDGKLTKSQLINKICTKLANLIAYLKKYPKHTIVFSQWTDLLLKVGEVLNEYNIKNVFCRGNVYTRDKAIRDFSENDNIKVIMLSSESAAAGANLTKAKRIVLLDPVYGDYQYRKDTEYQAIGRAHRLGQTDELEVCRFIVKDTIEEDIYKKNKINDMKYIPENEVEEFEID